MTLPLMPSTPLRRRLLLAALLFAGFSLLYLHGASPAFHPDDSPEAITCGATLSIQHPPGYPLHSLLGRLACLALPGTPAWGVTALAALLGSLSVALLFWLALELLAGEGELSLLYALLAALAAGLAYTQWFQSGIAKGGIYTLNLALTLAALISLVRAARQLSSGGAARQSLAAAGLWMGLGLANHWTSQAALIPCAALLLLPALLKRQRWPWRSILRSKLLALAGLTLYLYLPLRSARLPPLFWGDLRSWRGFLAVLGRAQYAGVEAGRGLENTWRLLGREALDLRLEFTWPGLLLLALGWALLVWRRRLLALALLAWPLCLLLAVAAMAHPPLDSLWVIDPYLLSAHAGLCLGLAGLAWLPRLPQGLGWRLGLVGEASLLGLALAAALALGLWHRPLASHRQDFMGYDYANNLLLSCPEHSLLFCEGDGNITGPLFDRIILGRRRDVAQVASVLADEAWYQDGLRARDPGLSVPPASLGVPQDLDYMSRNNLPRPSAFTCTLTPAWVDERFLLPRGIIFLRQGQAGPFSSADLGANALMPAYSLRGVFAPALAQDPIEERLVTANYRDSLARLAMAYQAGKDYARAEQAFSQLGSLKPGWDAPWIQAGNMAYFRKDMDSAERHWRRALREQPRSADAMANIGLCCLQRKEYQRGLEWAAQALEIEPQHANALQLSQQCQVLLASGGPAPRVEPGSLSEGQRQALLGDREAQAGHAAEALRAYQKALELGVDGPNLRRNMAAMLDKQGDSLRALDELRQAGRLAPADAEISILLVQALRKAGDPASAKDELDRALSLHPGDMRLKQLMAQKP
jgi:tetratricopeptide (TPR) repeat protein